MPNFIQIAPTQQNCDVITIFQDGSNGISILVLVSFVDFAQLQRMNCISESNFGEMSQSMVAFFWFVGLTSNAHTEFEGSKFVRSRDIKGS